MRILLCAGTRPEAVKLAPVALALRRYPGVELVLCATAQHRGLLDRALADFGLKADLDLGAPPRGASLAAVFDRIVERLLCALERLRPDWVVVQGDTTAAWAAAYAAACARVRVAHVEAGLRSHDRRQPFPEEDWRVLIDSLATVHFAPTARAAKNLRREGYGNSVLVTGNTAVDALKLARLPRTKRARAPYAVVTLHRRESWGRPLAGIFCAVREAAERLERLDWVFPVHPNPAVARAARRFLVHPRVRLIRPLSYPRFLALMRGARFLVTDSGGIQEEAPSLGVPVLIVRDKTERPELLCRGGVLAGRSPKRLLKALLRFGSGSLPRVARKNPFGDGRAARRIAAALVYGTIQPDQAYR